MPCYFVLCFSRFASEAAEHKIWWCQFHPFDVWHPKQMPYSAFVTLLSDSISALHIWFCSLRQGHYIHSVNLYCSLVLVVLIIELNQMVSASLFSFLLRIKTICYSLTRSQLLTIVQQYWICSLKQGHYFWCAFCTWWSDISCSKGIFKLPNGWNPDSLYAASLC